MSLAAIRPETSKAPKEPGMQVCWDGNRKRRNAGGNDVTVGAVLPLLPKSGWCVSGSDASVV